MQVYDTNNVEDFVCCVNLTDHLSKQLLQGVTLTLAVRLNLQEDGWKASRNWSQDEVQNVY